MKTGDFLFTWSSVLEKIDQDPWNLPYFALHSISVIIIRLFHIQYKTPMHDAAKNSTALARCRSNHVGLSFQKLHSNITVKRRQITSFDDTLPSWRNFTKLETLYQVGDILPSW